MKCGCGEQAYHGRAKLPSIAVDCDDDSFEDIVAGGRGCDLTYDQLNIPGYAPLDTCLAERLVGQAHRELDAITLKPDRRVTVPLFQLEELVLGNLLGSGSFSTCYEITSIQLLQNKSFTPIQKAARNNLAEERKRLGTTFVVKHLRSILVDRPKKFANAAIDLVNEAHYLCCLSHPHIVNIRGIAAEGPDGFSSGRHDGFFFVMDLLPQTLEDKILEWRVSLVKFKRTLMLWTASRDKKRNEMFLERLVVAFKIASAIDYLHSRDLIFRDLKPSNIGFDSKGEVKVFDFGLCRHCSGDGTSNKRFKMSGKVGTRRFMAPEVARCEKYNTKADVYSFGIVLYEMMSLNQACSGDDDVGDYVPARLPTCPCWPASIQLLLAKIWSHDVDVRPTMAEVCSIVSNQISDFRRGATSHGGRQQMPASRLATKVNNPTASGATMPRLVIKKSSKYAGGKSVCTGTTASTQTTAASIATGDFNLSETQFASAAAFSSSHYSS